MSSFSRRVNKKSESQKRKLVISDKSVKEVFSPCTRQRIHTPGDFHCENKCSQMFGDPLASFEAIKKFREQIWINPKTTTKKLPKSFKKGEGRDAKNIALVSFLFQMWNGKTFNFNIHGKTVCEEFFHRATGITRKTFLRHLKYVMDSTAEHRQTVNINIEKNIQNGNAEDMCGFCFTDAIPKTKTEITITAPKEQLSSQQSMACMFLDDYFKRGDIDRDPNGKKVSYTRETWKEIHTKYAKDFENCDLKPLTYEAFVSLRLFVYICIQLFYNI